MQAPLAEFALIEQLIPAGSDTTEPIPVFPGADETWIVYLGTAKRAVTLRAWSKITRHVPVPVQAPVHPSNVPSVAVAVSVTAVPRRKLA